MYGTLSADRTYHYHVADYNNCVVMEMDPGQKEEQYQWHMLMLRCLSTLHQDENSFVYVVTLYNIDQRNYE